MHNRQKSRFFIVGCPRSGTTLLQSLLSAHSQIASFPESKFFLNLVNLPVEKSRRYSLGLISSKLRPVLHDFFETIERPELAKQLPKLPFIQLYVNSFTSILDTLTIEQGKKLWIEKTPEHLHSIDYIEKFIEQPKIIHIVRNGCDVIASLYELTRTHPETWNYYSKWELDDYINKWIADVKISSSHLHKPNHTLIQYEKLVENPHDVLQELCEFIDVKFESQMLHNYKTSVNSLIRSREVWKSKVTQSIQRNNSQKFENIFGDQEKEYIRNKVNNIDFCFATK